MASYPVEPMYDAYGKPICPSEYPPVGYPMAPQYPGMPPQYPMMQPGPYVPRPMDPAYSQGKTCITSLRVSSHGCRVSWSCQYMSNHNQEQKLLLHVKNDVPTYCVRGSLGDHLIMFFLNIRDFSAVHPSMCWILFCPMVGHCPLWLGTFPPSEENCIVSSLVSHLCYFHNIVSYFNSESC